MASFNRADYERVYRFALDMLGYFESKPEETEITAILDLCENVIGQQSDRPDWSRTKSP